MLIKRVKVTSVFDAFEYVMEHYYPAGQAENAIRKDTYAVISLQDSHTGGFGVAFTESKTCKGVLTLQVDDIVREVSGAVLFDDAMAAQVIRFIDEHRDAQTLLVHCYAGQSRSRAVGAFALKYLGARNDVYLRGSPNMHIYNTLLRAAEIGNLSR